MTKEWGPIHSTDPGSPARRAGIVGWQEPRHPMTVGELQQQIDDMMVNDYIYSWAVIFGETTKGPDGLVRINPDFRAMFDRDDVLARIRERK